MMVTTASGGAPTAGATQHIKLMQARAERSEGGVCEQHWSLFGWC